MTARKKSNGKTRKTSATRTTKATTLLATCGVRPGTNRDPLLTTLYARKGKPVPMSDLVAAVYGKGKGEAGPLRMVMLGLEVSMKKMKSAVDHRASQDRPRHRLRAHRQMKKLASC